MFDGRVNKLVEMNLNRWRCLRGKITPIEKLDRRFLKNECRHITDNLYTDCLQTLNMERPESGLFLSLYRVSYDSQAVIAT